MYINPTRKQHHPHYQYYTQDGKQDFHYEINENRNSDCSQGESISLFGLKEDDIALVKQLVAHLQAKNG